MKGDRAETRKAQFITEYKALCEKYEMIVVQLHGVDKDVEEEYEPFAVADIRKRPQTLREQLDEMLLTDLYRVAKD